MNFKRGADGKVSGFVLKQPEGEFEFTRAGSAAPAAADVSISVDELMTRVIKAAGGEANLRKHKVMMVSGAVEFQNHGITGESVTIAKAPNSSSNRMTLIGLGKRLGTIHEYFDGTTGGSETTFSPAETFTDKYIDDQRIASDFHQLLNWKTLFKTVVVKEKSKLGDEEVYVVVKTPEKGNPVTEYISARSFLVLKRDLLRQTIGADAPAPSSESYSDFRDVDGWMLPFTTTAKVPGFGNVVMRVKEVKFDVDVPASEFSVIFK